MPTANARLAAALRILQRLQKRNAGVIGGSSLTDGNRQLLVETGFLRPILKGWYMCANPRDSAGDSTVWFANYWVFVAGYLRVRFGKRYCLSPVASILLHTGSTVVPQQTIVVTTAGGSSTVNLPEATSLLVYQHANAVPKSRVELNGLQLWPLDAALCRVDSAFFRNHAQDAEIALQLIRDPGELLTALLSGGGMPTAAGRLAGALRFLGRGDDADRIVHVMMLAGHSVHETNPFVIPAPTLQARTERSPYVLRLRSMWATWRQAVMDAFPVPPGLPLDASAYLATVRERYAADAYNSLSIEGYQVSDALIARVATGRWNPEEDDADRQSRDALAARGYYLAFQQVKASLAAILAGANPGDLARKDHYAWFAGLFAPSVRAGLVDATQLAGYRGGPVYIRNSMHTPPPRDAIADSMDALFDLLGREPSPAVRAVLGHHLFAFVHPYADGNGRMARFLMNAMLASGGYPWTVIRVSRRADYLAALEAASTGGDIVPFARFVAEEMAAGA
jgi:hypothetical protein